MTTSNLLQLVHDALAGESGRVLATALVLGMTLALSRLLAHVIMKRESGSPVDALRSGDTARLRHKLVWAKNFVWGLGTFIVLTIWASRIAGIALSLAAVAGGLLIVSKELLMSILGYGVIAVSRPYRIGDFVEVGSLAGRVIDVDVLSTTLSETGSNHHLTGKLLTFPNSLLLSNAVRNTTATGRYILNLQRMVLPLTVDVALAERAALQAAQEVCNDWRDDAERHLQQVEEAHLLDLPSAREKVLWECPDGKALVLTIRFACPMVERVNAEQAIFRRFWSLYQEVKPLAESRHRE